MISTHGTRMTSAHYARMGEAECRLIHLATLEVLDRVGVDVHEDRAREILAGGGAGVEGIRVRIPEYLVEEALRKAPRRMTIYDRNGKVAMRAHDYNTYYGGGSDCLHVLDHHTGLRREPMLMDVHGAGAQRSDPKSGNPNDYPTGRGPQGDAIRIYNYVRCVRNAN